MANVKEQMVTISDSSYDVNRYLQQGWRIVSVTAQHVASDTSYKELGKFCFVLERDKQ